MSNFTVISISSETGRALVDVTTKYGEDRWDLSLVTYKTIIDEQGRSQVVVDKDYTQGPIQDIKDFIMSEITRYEQETDAIRAKDKGSQELVDSLNS